MTNIIAVLTSVQNVKVIEASIDNFDYISVDLSIKNKNLASIDVSSSKSFEKFINNYLDKNNAKVAYGGYNETRNLYKRSTVFKDDLSPERNIHIGLDLWIAAKTNVLAALDGVIHSFKNNVSLGDYGPTIILEHLVNGIQFYTLYGHLSTESLYNLHIGKQFRKGEKLATLGNYPINGDYSPHLHFQIIQNIENYQGDYPGVCSSNDLVYYLKNCPDPNYLLKL